MPVKSLIAITFLAGSVFGSEPELDPKFTALAEKTATDRREVISRELIDLAGHPWAGNYYSGDGLGMNVSLSIAPESGYVFQWRGCGGIYDRNYGAIEERDGRLLLSFTFKNKRHGFQGIAPELIPVPWGARHYLIPAEEIVGFCNEVNDGSEPRDGVHGFFLLRTGDEKLKVTGYPDVPEKYRPYLLKQPIEAEIIAVGQFTTRPSIIDFKFVDTRVTLNKGTKDGLRVGMRLHVAKPKLSGESVAVIREEPDRCEAIMTQTDEKSSGPRPNFGWRLSTQAPWRTRHADRQQ